MKRKMFPILIICLILIGCGQQEEPTNEPTSETIQESVTNEEPESETIQEVESEEVESEVMEEVESEESESTEPTQETTDENGYTEEDLMEPYGLNFPEGIEGFTDKWVFKNDETWSHNQTHFVAANGTVMDFIWEGPTELGTKASAGETTLFLGNENGNYELRAWGGEIKGLEDALREYDKETIVGWDASNSTHTEGDYYEFIDGDIDARVTFKITRTIDGVDYTGYACYFDNYETMTYYQMAYVERNDVYDDARALKVVNSFDFWTDYEPKE